MGTRDRRIDSYIASSAAFAKPILSYLREVVHEACPAVEEGMKWRMPHFMYHGILCGMAAFKEHCAFGFWKASLVMGRDVKRDAMGSFGCIKSLDDLPPKRQLIRLIRNAMRLNEEGVPSPTRARRAAKPKPEVVVPTELASALRKNARARATFDAFPPSHRREYVEWITEAKRDATRQRRVETTIAQLSEGKAMNWKYERAGQSGRRTSTARK